MEYDRRIAMEFAAEVLNFVYRDRRVLLLPYQDNGMYANIGILVSALIKGRLRNENILAIHMNNIWTEEDIIMFLRTFSQWHVEQIPTAFSILEGIALTAICSIFFHVRDTILAQVFAYQGVSLMLLNLENGQFVRSGGLAQLNDYARNVLASDRQLMEAFRNGTYPW